MALASACVGMAQGGKEAGASTASYEPLWEAIQRDFRESALRHLKLEWLEDI